MKKNLYFLLVMFFVPLFASQAADTFYVNPFADGADDANPGTENAPWVTLNIDKWTDNCTIKVQSYVYLDGAMTMTVMADNVTLEGSSPEEAVIMALEDDAFADGSENAERYFDLYGKTFTVKNVTIRNMRNSAPLGYGGFFQVDEESSLTLENVVLKNVFLPGAGGGAIATMGTLNCKNVLFENCVSRQGAAVAILGQAPATFTDCTFQNNSCDDEVDDYRLGGAVLIETPNANVSFDKCYFDSNKCEAPADKYPAGGAIYLRGVAPKLSVTNSCFYNNVAGTGGGAVNYQRGEQDDPQSIELTFINNVFAYNKLTTTGGAHHGVAINFDWGSYDKINGKFVLVNNTFFQNCTENTTQSSVFMNSLKIDLVMVNNISMDLKTMPDESKIGFAFVFQENPEAPFHSALVSNNLIEGGIGGGHLPEGLGGAIENGTGNNFVATNEDVRLAETLTIPATGVPYLPITDELSLAVDGGADQATLDGINLVPGSDIRGAAKAGDRKDIGSFEFNGPSAIKNTSTGKQVATVAYPNPFNEILLLSTTAARIEIFDMTGICRQRETNSDRIITAALPSGSYIIRITDKDGRISTQTLQK